MPAFQDFTVIATLVPLRHDPDVGSSGFAFRGIGDVVSASTDVMRDKHGDGWRELPSGDFIQNDRLGTSLLKAVEVLPPPPDPIIPPVPSISHPYFLNVASAAMVFVAPNRAAAVLGVFPSDPAWQNPIQLSAGAPLANDDRMWRQVLNCSDLKLIGGWVIEGEPGYAVRYFYQPPQ